ncbi:MAG: NAD-dependent epimerase/dehydratase family protein [Magnetovibrionaceae bacterium]
MSLTDSPVTKSGLADPSKGILVTGGSGYLGGRLCLALAEAGYQILIPTRRDPLPSWMESPGLQPIRFDQFDPLALAEPMVWVDTVIHLAAVNEVVAGKDPDAALNMAGPIQRKLLDLAIDANVKRFLKLSSAHVYGAPLVGRFDEDDACTPTHPYGIQHLLGERLVARAGEKSEMATLSVRLSNAFGAPADTGVDRWTLVVNDLCAQAVEQKALYLRSDGRQERDFLPLGEALAGLRHLLTLDHGTWRDLGVVNLASGLSTAVIDMAKRVQRVASGLLGNDIPLSIGKGGGATGQVEISLDRLKSTGWQPWGPDDSVWDREIEDCLRLLMQGASKG